MKFLLKTLVFIPLCIELLLLLVVFQNKFAGVVWVTHISITILLTVIGIGIVSNKKILQQSGNSALIILTELLFVIGYYDYVQWFSSIIGVVIFIYFVVIKIAIKKLK